MLVLTGMKSTSVTLNIVVIVLSFHAVVEYYDNPHCCIPKFWPHDDDDSLPWPTRDNGFRRPMGGQDLVFYFSNGLI